MLCLLVDLAALDGTSPAEQERVLLAELGDYRPDLLERPRLVVGTKADITSTTDPAELGFVPDGEHALRHLGRHRRRRRPARRGDGLARPRGAAGDARAPRASCSCGPSPTGAAVDRVGDSEFRVSGRDVERVVALNDVTSTDAMSYIGHRLERLGVNKLLARAGAADGDVVWIGDFSFEYRDA